MHQTNTYLSRGHHKIYTYFNQNLLYNLLEPRKEEPKLMYAHVIQPLIA